MKTSCLLLLATLVLFACGKKNYAEGSEPCTTSATGDTVVLSYQQPLRIFEKCYDSLTASITKITDSRCPKDVQCVWAGTVHVLLRLDENFTLNLEIGKQIDTTYNQRRFSFTLIDVTPYPVASANTLSPEESKAMIRMIKN